MASKVEIKHGSSPLKPRIETSDIPSKTFFYGIVWYLGGPKGTVAPGIMPNLNYKGNSHVIDLETGYMYSGVCLVDEYQPVDVEIITKSTVKQGA